MADAFVARWFPKKHQVRSTLLPPTFEHYLPLVAILALPATSLHGLLAHSFHHCCVVVLVGDWHARHVHWSVRTVSNGAGKPETTNYTTTSATQTTQQPTNICLPPSSSPSCPPSRNISAHTRTQPIVTPITSSPLTPPEPPPTTDTPPAHNHPRPYFCSVLFCLSQPPENKQRAEANPPVASRGPTAASEGGYQGPTMNTFDQWAANPENLKQWEQWASTPGNIEKWEKTLQ